MDSLKPLELIFIPSIIAMSRTSNKVAKIYIPFIPVLIECTNGQIDSWQVLDNHAILALGKIFLMLLRLLA